MTAQASAEVALVLGAGPGQVRSIEALRGRGCEVVAVDRDPAAPGFRMASRGLHHSTHDAAGLLRAIAAAVADGMPRPTAICCPTTGVPYLVAAEVAAELGLGFPSRDAVSRLFDKHALWLALGELGLTRRRCVALAPADPLPEVDFPVVVKPRWGGGANAGVSVCRASASLGAAVQRAAAASLGGPEAVVESVCRGPEIKAAGVLVAGEPELLLVAGRTFGLPGEAGLGLPIAVALGASRDPRVGELERALGPAVAALFRAIEIRDAAFSVDIVDTADGPEIIDVDITFGSLALLAERALGLDLSGAQVDIALGRDPELRPTLRRGAAATYLWLVEGAGAVEAAPLLSLEGLAADPWLRGGGRAPGSRPLRVGRRITEAETQEDALESGAAWLLAAKETLQRALGRQVAVAMPRGSRALSAAS